MRTLLIAAICLGAALPASAEEKKTMMMKPTMEQCQGGWKSEYRELDALVAQEIQKRLPSHEDG